MQRRHQKLIEETPPPKWSERGQEMGEAAVALSKAAGYVNAGTVEMLVDRDGTFYFLEVNSRLQVEHTVTEEVFGIDLVRCQLQIASGDDLGFTQADLMPGGHGIECRINAEDPANNFMPTPGVITRYVEPTGIGIRVDSGYGRGSEVPSVYDSLIAKLITWGQNRIEARDRMSRALNAFEIEGIKTTIPAHLLLLDNEEFIAGTHTTRTVETGALAVLETEDPDDPADVLLVEGHSVLLWNPAMAVSASAAVHGVASKGGLVAPMQGTILSVFVEQGQTVEAGDAICVLEAMKMETTISAPVSGVIKELNVAAGDTATAGTVLAVIE
jgi:Acetyl/propionyl-CoA carboxylase, alpha subunit